MMTFLFFSSMLSQVQGKADDRVRFNLAGFQCPHELQREPPLHFSFTTTDTTLV